MFKAPTNRGLGSQQAPASSKSRLPEEVLCKYTNHVCHQNALEGYGYCLDHIFEDVMSPYRHCVYEYPESGEQCNAAALISDSEEPMCQKHAVELACKAASEGGMEGKRGGQTAASLADHLSRLRHYSSKVDWEKSLSSDSEDSDCGGKEGGVNSGPQDMCLPDPESITKAASPHQDVQTCVGMPRMKVSSLCTPQFDSDDESIGSDCEDPLKHADVFTVEESVRITRDKLVRLQSLYLEQFKWLQHELRESRRKYLHTVRKEKEAGKGNVGLTSPGGMNAQDSQEALQLKALKRHHRHVGKELLLHRQWRDRRKQVTYGSSYRQPHTHKCIHSDLGVKCARRTLPQSKYCPKHVLQDRNQVLFEPCSAEVNENACRTPIIPILDGPSCVIHTRTLPPLYPTHIPDEWMKSSAKQGEETKIDEGEAVDLQPNKESPVKPSIFAVDDMEG